MAAIVDIRGYTCTFLVTPAEELQCRICQLPAREPHLSVCCGNNFCAECLKRVSLTDGECPACKEGKHFFTTFPNKLSDRLLKKMFVLCTNSEKGCGWKEKLSDLEEHLVSCPFEELLCSAGCGMEVQRQELDGHLETECPSRPAECEFCQLAGEHQFITGQHREECPNRIVPCPNSCGIADLSCAKLKEHLAGACPLRKTPCCFHSVGCTAEVTAEKQAEHDEESVKEHLQLTTVELAKITEEIAKLKVEQPKEKKQVKRLIWPDEESSVEGEQDNSTQALQEQLESAVARLQGAEEEFDRWKNLTKTALQIITAGLKWMPRLEVSSAIADQSETIAPVIVKIREVSKMKVNGLTFASNAFFTGIRGYRACLNVNFTRREVSTEEQPMISVYIKALSGPYDSELKWPVEGSFTISLLNQLGNYNHHMTTYEVFGSLPENMMSADDFLMCEYIKDDTAYFHVTHQTTGN